MLAVLANLVLLIAAIITGDFGWLFVGCLLLWCVFEMPAGFALVVRDVQSAHPRLSPHMLLARWLPWLGMVMVVGVFGWAVWFGFGKVWMGILAALGMGLPFAARTTSLVLMEPGQKKDRVYLACTTAAFAVPMAMLATFAAVYGPPGR